jgi:hypothetical protein
MDEWTSRKIGSKSGVTPKILTHEAEADKELDKDIKATTTGTVIDPKKELVIKKLQEAFLKFPDTRYQHQIKIFVEAHIFKKNGDAIIHCLNSLLNNKKPVPNPKGYLEKALAVENGNVNADEALKEHEEHKKPIPVDGIAGLGNVLKAMAGG